MSLSKAVEAAVAKGLERPDALEAVISSGVDCTENEFRSAFRTAQHAFNRKSRPKAKAKKK